MSNPQQHIGLALKQLRKNKGWSLDVTAKATGVSKAMLGQIERGESSPTIAVLWKIATGSQTSLSYFLGPEVKNEVTPIFTSNHATREKPAQDDMLVATLFPFEDRFGFEVYELTLLPGYERYSEPHEAGVTEHILVTQGEMELFIEGSWCKIAEGDAVRFQADQPHGYRNLGNKPAAFHDIIHYPNRKPS